LRRYLEDPLHSSLRDVLDELIELHSKLAPQSIFTESIKAYVQTTISKLMEVIQFICICGLAHSYRYDM